MDKSTERTDLNQKFNIASNLDNEDIMSEMQTLNVRPESKEVGRNGSSHSRPLMFSEIQITEIDVRQK